MTSTGNDIVALKAIDIARTKEVKFYSKIISHSEKDLFDRQAADKLPFENFVWLLWSIKESVYKYLQRITPELVFSPTKVVVEELELPMGIHPIKFEGIQAEGRDFDEASVYKATIVFGPQKLYCRSIINEELIASVVNHEDDFKNTCWGIKRISSSETVEQSREVRIFLINRLKDLFPGYELHIGKSPQGYPILLNGSDEMDIPISLAHHDCYVTYSFQLKENSTA